MVRATIWPAIAATVLLVVAQPAAAGVSVHYSSDHWKVHAHLGGYGGWYGGLPGGWYRPATYGGYGRTYGWPTISYSWPSHSTWPSYSYYYRRPVITYSPFGIVNTPYVPPGTVYTYYPAYYPSSYYPYYWPRDYGSSGFYDAYLRTTPGVSSTTRAPSSQPVINNITVTVNTPAQPGTQSTVTVTPSGRSWDRYEWRVPVAPAPQPAPGTTAPGPRQPVPGAAQPAPAVGPSGVGATQVASPGPAKTEVVNVPATSSPEAASQLVTLVRGKDDEREKAAQELKRHNTPVVIDALVDALRRDGSADVREEAARSLGAMLATKALTSLWQAAREDGDGDVRSVAREAALKIEAFAR